MDKCLTFPISEVSKVENHPHAIEERTVSLCMGIIKPNGDVIIPEQVRA